MITIFDSMTKTKKVLSNNKNVDLYLCGPTVYNYVHVGNVRPVIVIDVLHRLLIHQKFKINYVHNITDIDDKIIKEANKQKTTEQKISEKYYLAYLNDLKTLNIISPTLLPKVSEFINDMITFIDKLLITGNAYISKNDVYFKVDNIKSYGILANKSLDQLLPNYRVSDNKLKSNPFDFALWKGTKHGLSWDSPWGQGRPGWHTECVVFIKKLILNQPINLHGGGVDLKFPHHENERAQFLAFNHKELARIWWHNGHINFNDAKMSKSLNNVILVKDFCEKYHPNVLRYLILNHDHQQPINFTNELIVEGEIAIKKYQTILQLWTYHEFLNFSSNKLSRSKHDFNSQYYEKVISHLSDNIATTKVFTIISAMIKDLYQAIKAADFSYEQQVIFNTLNFSLELLGFDFQFGQYDQEIINKIVAWETLKKQKDFVNADLVRSELQALNILPK